MTRNIEGCPESLLKWHDMNYLWQTFFRLSDQPKYCMFWDTEAGLQSRLLGLIPINICAYYPR